MNSHAAVHHPVCNPMMRMEIRFDGLGSVGGLRTVNGARFGMVRDGGKRPHQGVDLYAKVGTPIFSVAAGEVVRVRRHHPSYGQDVLIRFRPDTTTATRLGLRADGWLYALYAHLSQITVAVGPIARGHRIGATGISGNADQRYPHLHFEIRTKADAGLGLHNRINPERIFGGIDYSKPVEALELRSRTV